MNDPLVSFRKKYISDEEGPVDTIHPEIIRCSPSHSKIGDSLAVRPKKNISARVSPVKDSDKETSQHLIIPKVPASSSSETLTGKYV